MKDLSFFILKNSLGAKMRKGIRTFCSGDGSTSTLNQHQPGHGDPSSSCMLAPSFSGSSPYLQHNNIGNSADTPPTLEEMILQLEFEEEIARKAKLSDYGDQMRGRMSCVNNSDILRSARNALNQYPRFSLDGKDAMYRSSFRNLDGARKSVGLRGRLYDSNFGSKMEKTLGGENVVWRKAGVVAKLMGLEAMPVPVRCSSKSKEKLRQSVGKGRISQRHEIERRLGIDINKCDGHRRGTKTAGYCVMKPVSVEEANGWPLRRFV